MRKGRILSPTNLYHVVIRGINKQNIFFENQERKYFLTLLKKYGKKYKVSVHAYCLMNNHVHLLLEDSLHNISVYMQCVASMYARFFNKKYDRIGHLFQSRFISENIIDDNYYRTVFRYILQNPQKAGICKTSEYSWSSYKAYKNKTTDFCSRKSVSYFENQSHLYEFLQNHTDESFADIELRPSEKEEYIKEKIKKLLKSPSTLISPDLPVKTITEKLKILKAAKISIRTISRLTGIMSWLVFKA